MDEDTGVFSLFFCSTGPDSCFWEFHPSSVTLVVFVFFLILIFVNPYVCKSKNICFMLTYVGKFQILLIIDNQETTTKSMFRGVLLKELSKYGMFIFLHTYPLLTVYECQTQSCQVNQNGFLALLHFSLIC